MHLYLSVFGDNNAWKMSKNVFIEYQIELCIHFHGVFKWKELRRELDFNTVTFLYQGYMMTSKKDTDTPFKK